MSRSYFLPLKHSAIGIALSIALMVFGIPLYSAPASANDVLPLFKANYQADIKGFRVKASRELLKQNANQYTLQFSASSMIASVEENISLNWSNNRITPLNYAFSRNVIGKKEERRISFDHTLKRIDAFYKDSQQAIPYSEQLLDSLSYQLQLQQDLRAGKSDLSYFIISKNETKRYHFKREKEEVLNTELGPLRTVKVSLTRESDKRQTQIWFAIDWQYLLVRFEQLENGKKEFVINLSGIFNEYYQRLRCNHTLYLKK